MRAKVMAKMLQINELTNRIAAPLNDNNSQRSQQRYSDDAVMEIVELD
jgi:hypothetical protein